MGGLRLALELGRPLHELYGWPGPLTHRQYEAWQAYLDDQWNEPDRHDHYLMQVSLLVARTMGGLKQGDLKGFKIDFRPEGARAPERISVRQETQWAQAKWFARMTMPVTIERPNGGTDHGT